MKTKSTTHALLFAGLLSVCACNNANSNKAGNMADSAVASTDTAVQNVKQDVNKMADNVGNAINGNPDSNFVVKACLDNSMELRLLHAGADSGTNKELKAHARMMIADHTKLGKKVAAYAATKGYILPEGDDGKANDELTTLSQKTVGADWDKEWVTALIAGHHDAIDYFEKEQDKVKDPELKNIITGALPTLHEHLNMLQQLQDKMGK